MSAHIVAAVIEAVLGLPKLFLTFGPIRLLLGLALFIPTLAVCVRRLHDTGRSGWWVGAVWALNTVLNIVAAVASAPGGSPSTLVGVGAIQLLVVGALLILCALPGTRGTNEYGPDPYQADVEEIFA